MFQRAIARYGLAVSLSLLVAVPFVVFVFATPHAASVSALWLSLIAVEWLLLQPSIKSGENFKEARRRVFLEMRHDPVLWFAIAAVVFSGVRALNGGLELAYDPESELWSVTEPWTVGLPSSVAGVGFDFFVLALSLFVVVAGIRHGLGKAARAMCLLVSSLVSACGGIAAVVMVCNGNETFLKLAGKGLFSPTWTGDAFCLWFIAASASLGQIEEQGWKKLGLPVVFLAIAGNAAGMFFLCPPVVAAGASVAAGLVALVSVNYAGFHAGLVAAARAVVVFSLAASLPLVALSGLASEDLCKAKVDGLLPSKAFTEQQVVMREALVENAISMWKDSPWLGKGLGSYGINAPFFAEKGDWSKLPSKIEFVPNGYAQILAERGIVGCIVALTGVLLLVALGLARFVMGYKALSENSDYPSPYLVVPPAAWAQFAALAFLVVLCYFAASPVVQTQTWAAFVFILAVASASFPVRRKYNSAIAGNTEK